MNPETATTETNLPQHLVLGGVTYNSNDNPELRAFIDGVAKVVTQREKTKVYSQIDALKNQLAELNKVVPVVNNTTQAPIDQSKLMEDIVTKLSGNFQTMLDTAIKPLKQKSDIAEQAALADYRLKLISENQDKCIPELIVGNTKAELDEALKSSQELRSKYGTIIPQTQPVTTPTTVTPAVTAVVPPVVTPASTEVPVVNPPAKTNATPVGTPDVKSMSMTEFAKKREELQAGLAALTQQ